MAFMQTGFLEDIRSHIQGIVAEELAKKPIQSEHLTERLVNVATFFVSRNYYEGFHRGIAERDRSSDRPPADGSNPATTEDGEPQPLPGKQSRQNGGKKGK